MNYIQWNNLIGEYLFNREKAEKEVSLFITEGDIIKLGKETGSFQNNENPFMDFISSFKMGVPGKPRKGNILDHALFAYEKWKENPLKICDEQIFQPLYLGYLTLFILPLTDNYRPNSRADAYYPKIKAFLEKFELPHLPYQNQSYNWNALWKDLEEWSILKKNTELGYFELHPFSNERWIYVGKPLSQSIFPGKAIQRLPLFYENTGLIPGEDLDEETIRKLLLNYGDKYLALARKTLNAVRDLDNELGHSIIGIIKKHYQQWTGSTDHFDEETETVTKGNTIANLKICIEGDTAKGYKIYYRLFTPLDYPEGLKFIYEGCTYECQQFSNGWSKPLLLPFLDGLKLEDNLNKWTAKLPEKKIRLFLRGQNFNMSGWVEVSYLTTSRMLLLIAEEYSETIEEWGSLFSKEDFIKLPPAGIPVNYSLYQISNPPMGHPDIPYLQFKTEKRINIVGGMKVGVRAWLEEILPQVELENGRGDENLYIKYDFSGEKINLKRKDVDQPVWLLPMNILTEKDFTINVEYTDAKGDHLKNQIITAEGKIENLKDIKLTARDKFGQIVVPLENDCYSIGTKLFIPEILVERRLRLRQAHYMPDFRPSIPCGNYPISTPTALSKLNEVLLSFLTVKGESTIKDYFDAFEVVYNQQFDQQEIESHNLELSLLKRWSLNYLDYMSFLDFEYSNKKIVVNPPQFVLIPTSTGRKVILIGGRTSEVINKIAQATADEGFYLKMEKQDTSLSPFLLPSTITITGYSENSEIEIERKLKKIADRCCIQLDLTKLPQFMLAEFSGNIDEYWNQLIPDETFYDAGWPARVFDPVPMRFVPLPSEDIDKSFALVEYRLTEYNFKHKLWKNGKSYNINKNWGRFIILNEYQHQVIFYDRNKKMVAIPMALPLPRLFSEAMTLFSGKSPKKIRLEIEGILNWFNIYENIPCTFSYNYFMKVGQKQRETNINI